MKYSKKVIMEKRLKKLLPKTAVLEYRDRRETPKNPTKLDFLEVAQVGFKLNPIIQSKDRNPKSKFTKLDSLKKLTTDFVPLINRKVMGKVGKRWWRKRQTSVL